MHTTQLPQSVLAEITEKAPGGEGLDEHQRQENHAPGAEQPREAAAAGGGGDVGGCGRSWV